VIQLSPEASKAAALKKEVEDCRFFPELVWASISGALGKQRMLGYLVHHEASFATGDLQRHLTALVLTDKQLIISHTDEQDAGYPDRAITSAEVVALRAIHSVVVTRSVHHPEKYRAARGTSSTGVPPSRRAATLGSRLFRQAPS